MAIVAPQEEIGFEHKGIGTVLNHHRLTVPVNQREYSWKDEHVTDLFSDFANAIATNKGTYFLGTIVLTRGDGNIPEVSDGQQRLATTSILLAAIRDYFSRHGDKARADSIEQTYLKETDIVTTEIVPKLRLNVDDNGFFTKYVIASPDSPDRKMVPSKDSHMRIQKAATLAAKHVEAILEPFKQDAAKTQRLLEWVKFIRDGARVILLRVPDHLNAFVMFETLNDRGLKASQADLLKNFLLGYAGDRITEAQQKWAQMIGVLETLSEEDITVKFLHHVLITKHGQTKEREVFERVRQSVNSQGKALTFLEELAESAQDYAALMNPDDKKWNDYGTSTRKHLSTINRELGVEQIRPLMFAVARHFSPKEGAAAFRLFVFWSVRFLIAGGRGGLLDRNYSARAQDIGGGKIKTAAALATAMTEILPSDALFETSFSEARVSQDRLARYYLRALQQKANGEQEPEFVPNDEEQAINLEHVLPQNPQAEWSEIDPETAAAYYKHLGNMVLLQAKKNSMIGNSSFAQKRAVLAASTYTLTSEVGQTEVWGIKEISQRQKRLAKLAVSTWPLTL